MIPALNWHVIQIGPVPIQVWGLFVALGIAVGLWVCLRVAAAYDVQKEQLLDTAFWVILGSFVGARIVYVVSEWHLYANNLGDIVKLWEGGASVTGGFLGAAVAAAWVIRHHNWSFWPMAETMILGLPIGLFIGRLGCFFIFDHPGRPTNFFLGQEYIDGMVRHNHGLYLSLNGLLITALFWWLWRRDSQRPHGFFIATFLLCYGAVRFVLDFFRAAPGDTIAVIDARFLGLTVAQYGALGMIVLGVYLWYAVVTKYSSNSHGKTNEKTRSKA